MVIAQIDGDPDVPLSRFNHVNEIDESFIPDARKRLLRNTLRRLPFKKEFISVLYIPNQLPPTPPHDLGTNPLPGCVAFVSTAGVVGIGVGEGVAQQLRELVLGE